MILLAAIHGILTRQTNPSWPDALQAFMALRDSTIVVLKKEYRAGPFPRWNNWIKDPALARSLVAEILQFENPTIWFVSHSNGAVVALHAIRRLAALGVPVAGGIFAGAAIEADIRRNGLGGLSALDPAKPPAFIAWSNRGDRVTDTQPQAGESPLRKLRDWVWGKLAWPYGSLGNTGWLLDGHPVYDITFRTVWCPSQWAHSGYWSLSRRQQTFESIHETILKN